MVNIGSFHISFSLNPSGGETEGLRKTMEWLLNGTYFIVFFFDSIETSCISF